MAYRNQEGYRDPAAGRAMANSDKEDWARRKETRKRRDENRNRPKIYVVCRYAGQVPRTIQALIRCCRYVIAQGGMPVAGHLFYPCILRDYVKEERELRDSFDLALLAVCDEVWIFQDEVGMTPAMREEEREAKRLKKPTKYFSMEVVP